MLYLLLADALLLQRFPRLVWLHLPAVIWAGLIEIGGFVCLLTPLENRLCRLNDGAGYQCGFVEHYLLPIIYPDELSRGVQIGLGVAVVIINVLAYAVLRRRSRRHED